MQMFLSTINKAGKEEFWVNEDEKKHENSFHVIDWGLTLIIPREK